MNCYIVSRHVASSTCIPVSSQSLLSSCLLTENDLVPKWRPILEPQIPMAILGYLPQYVGYISDYITIISTLPEYHKLNPHVC